MKHLIPQRTGPTQNVAPRTGAWIETFTESQKLLAQVVAPRTGAWIETRKAIASLFRYVVAPRTGAWIETG